jgi:death-on-curing protein
VHEVEQIIYQMASEFYPEYPDPMPAFHYIGGEYGKGLLDSALAQPRQMWGGRFVYRTIYDKAATLLFSMINNHPFLDGNKRMGLATTTVFQMLNGVMLCATKEESVELCLSIARSEIEDWKPVSKWMRSHSVNFTKFVALSKSGQKDAASLMLDKVEYSEILEEAVEITRSMQSILLSLVDRQIQLISEGQAH